MNCPTFSFFPKFPEYVNFLEATRKFETGVRSIIFLSMQRSITFTFCEYADMENNERIRKRIHFITDSFI
jgi:hypothetical protein